MKIVHQEQALHIAGIELRTTNQEAFETIPRHWQRFSEEGVFTCIPGRLSDEVYAVYTNFENAGRNNEGLYSLVIGARVSPDAALPQDLARMVAPAARRAVFPVERGRFDLVGAAWQAIWARHDLEKTYIADYERYGADGTIDIFIGIAREPLPA